MKLRKQKRYFSPEFKEEVLNKIERGEVTVSEAAAAHDLSVTMICRWKRQARNAELDSTVDQAPRVEQSGVDPKYVRHLESKLREANEKLGELYIVVEGFKKIQSEKSMKNANSFVVTANSLAQSKRRAK